MTDNMINKTVCIPRELAGKLAEALRVFIGHDSGSNLHHKYGERWWEPIDAMQDELRDILAHPPAPTVPEGYALVPVEPTPEMIMAGIDNNPTSRNEDTDQGFPAQIANDVYRAMLSAALQPTEGSTDD